MAEIPPFGIVKYMIDSQEEQNSTESYLSEIEIFNLPVDKEITFPDSSLFSMKSYSPGEKQNFSIQNTVNTIKFTTRFGSIYVCRESQCEVSISLVFLNKRQ